MMEERIRQDLAESFGLAFDRCTPVPGGWLNQKWKIMTGSGAYLVKRYSNERFRRDQVEQIELALQRQLLLEQSGIPCPHILTCEGRAIRMLDEETAYMVMSFCPGRIEGPSTVTDRQLEDLGRVCGQLHWAFSRLPTEGVKGCPINGSELLSGLWDYTHARIEEISSGTDPAFRRAVLSQEAILQGLTPEFFDRLPKQIGHEDFTPDNMLFHPEGVAAVLDFDRNQYSFALHDVGRALLSFALKDGLLATEKIAAFIGGYSAFFPLSPRELTAALRITWCIEVPWWIQEAVFASGEQKILRFRDEILWVTEHWFELESLLSI